MTSGGLQWVLGHLYVPADVDQGLIGCQLLPFVLHPKVSQQVLCFLFSPLPYHTTGPPLQEASDPPIVDMVAVTPIGFSVISDERQTTGIVSCDACLWCNTTKSPENVTAHMVLPSRSGNLESADGTWLWPSSTKSGRLNACG